MMKSRILTALLGFCLLWAVTVTVLYWRLKNNPRVVAVTTEAVKENLQTQQLADIERLTFLRQYLDRYFSFDSNSFWQSQTSLAFLMTPSLGEARIREVSRLREKIQQKNLSQLGQLRLLSQTGDGGFDAQIYLQTTESSQKNNLTVFVHLKLHNTERTLENPWGLLVQEMTFLSSSPVEATLKSQIRIKAKSPTFLTLPCAIENIENPDEKNIKIKITTLNVSELQVTAVNHLTSPVKVSAVCRDLEYIFELLPALREQTLFVTFPQASGVPRKRDSNRSPRKKDIYDKTIENVLGIELEQ